MGKFEITEKFMPILSTSSNEYISLGILPEQFSLMSYVELIFDTPEFFVVFWNSMEVVMFVIIGQFIIAVLAAWGLTIYKIRYKKAIVLVYIIMMMLPFMVLMVPQYKILDQFNLINSLWSLILPGIFSSFPVIVIYMFFKKIPPSVFEAAKMDGAKDYEILLKIGIPLAYPGIISALLLSFIEYWNIIEQPLVFIDDSRLTLLSLYLPNINIDNISVTLAASVVTLIPSILIFVFGQSYLEKGVSSIIVKEL